MTTPTSTSRTRGWLTAVGTVVVLLAATLLVGPLTGPAPGPPLDPDSTQPDGLLGLVRMLEDLDVEVAVTTSPPGDHTVRAFVPADVLSTPERDAWRAWVAEGGTLIASDRWSDLHDRPYLPPGFAEGMMTDARIAGCPEIPPMVSEVVHDGWVGVAHEPGDTDCYGVDADHSWLVATPMERGRLILLGSAEPFTNAWLDEGDNAVLAAALLAPGAADRVVLVPRSDDADVGVGLLDLVPDGVWHGLALLLAAALLAIVARARRLGRPVEERLPPVLPSAELATSLAGLSRRAGDRDGAAARLRDRARSAVARHLGAGPTTDPQQLLSRYTTISRWGRDEVAAAFTDDAVRDDDHLLAIAQACARVLQDLAAVDPADQRPTARDATESM